MRFWRIAISANSGLDGEGARLYGGRWNSEGVAVVYASTHLSLAVLEVLVHVPPHLWPESTRAFAITLPDSAAVERLEDLASGPKNADESKVFGDTWIAAGKGHAMIVPSAIVPAVVDGAPTGEANALLNPRFATDWTVQLMPFRLDERLRRAV